MRGGWVLGRFWREGCRVLGKAQMGVEAGPGEWVGKLLAFWLGSILGEVEIVGVVCHRQVPKQKERREWG